MKVFLSWSGEQSRKIALELHEWLPMVLQSVEPYMSAESIEKGTRWASSVASELEGSSVGIVIMTPDNLLSPWIHFEAGALSKVVGESKLAPLLCGLKPSDIGAPLSQFQVTLFSKEDVLKLLKSINSTSEEDALPEGRLEKMHHALWDDLNLKIEPILKTLSTRSDPPKKKDEASPEVLEEILTLVRQQATGMTSERFIRDTVQMVLLETNKFAVESQMSTSLKYAIRSLASRWSHLRDEIPRDATPEGVRLNDRVEKMNRVVSDLRRMTGSSTKPTFQTWTVRDQQTGKFFTLPRLDPEPGGSDDEAPSGDPRD